MDAQERGAIALGQAIEGLGVNTRVLLIGAHPDDEDTFLIAWLQRGRHVETAYLSLTRGDGGQNLIGNELGEALGVIRTEELLGARRIDGARQYFTRAFDFGFSKDTIDTYKHWQRDSILGDVVRVVRAFRPHVIVAMFGGTRRDGHGHHQVSGLLARAAYDLAADTARFPSSAYGPSWTPLKFYRNARYDPTGGETLRIDVGEYSPLLGRSYAEIAGESRSQHKSQGFGALQRKGPVIDALRREATRVNASTVATAESSIFDGIDTSWARFRGGALGPAMRAALDSIPLQAAAARRAYDAFAPRRSLGALGPYYRSLLAVCGSRQCDERVGSDLSTSMRIALARAERAVQLASGLELEATSDREQFPVDRPARVSVTLYNRGSDTAAASMRTVLDGRPAGSIVVHRIAPGEAWRDTMVVRPTRIDQAEWLRAGRVGAMFATAPAVDPGAGIHVAYEVMVPGIPQAVLLTAPVTYRTVDAVKGELNWPTVGAPAVSASLDQTVQYVPAGVDFDRTVSARVGTLDDSVRSVRVTLGLPKGLSADSASRTLTISRAQGTVSVAFRVRGRLAAGEYRVDARAESNGETFASGAELIDYDHIRRQRIYRSATTRLSAVDLRVPGTLRVAYITGVGDNVAPALAQLGIPTTVIAAGDIVRADLTPYTTIVVGPRAYEAHPELLAANPKLFDFARKGGVLLVQYGQYEMTQPGAMPFPITLARPADRVTEEDAAVTLDAPAARELTAPNRIGAPDFAGWVQERSLYMPRTFDEHYRALMSIHDTGEPDNKGGVLIAPLGDGLYIYTTLSFFRQLPAGVPGGARLFVNLLSAKLAPSVTP